MNKNAAPLIVLTFTLNCFGADTAGVLANNQAGNVMLQSQMYYYSMQEEEAKYSAQQSDVAYHKAAWKKIYSTDPWRVIDGQTNSIFTNGWLQWQGIVLEIHKSGVVFQGAFGAPMSLRPPQESDIKPEDYGDDIFIVKDFPYMAKVGDGWGYMLSRYKGYCTYTNSQRDQVITIKQFEYGTPCVKLWSPEEIEAAKQAAENRKKEIEANKKAVADKVLKANQEAAEKGDVYGMLRMGERYRDGEGVPKDLAKAKDYLQKAVDGGSKTAEDDLSRFPARSSSPVARQQ